MSPTSRPAQPTFEGRPFARPEDELVDQGAAFDATTLFSRRRMLGVLGIGMGTVALAACGADPTSSGSTTGSTSSGSSSASGTATGEIPEETNGPYPADGTQDLNILEQSGIERQDIRTSLDGGEAVAGVALTMTFVVTDMANDRPFAGAAVYAWHCDAEGRYSMYSDGVTDQTWLRGVQVADADGKVSFTTIVPGCYSGRWPHIHFEVYPDKASATDVDNVVATSQVAFPQDMLTPIYARSEYGDSARNMSGVGSVESDMIFSDSLDLQSPTITGSIGSGYTATLQVGVDTTTEPSAGGGGGGMPGGPGGGQPPAPRT